MHISLKWFIFVFSSLQILNTASPWSCCNLGFSTSHLGTVTHALASVARSEASSEDPCIYTQAKGAFSVLELLVSHKEPEESEGISLVAMSVPLVKMSASLLEKEEWQLFLQCSWRLTLSTAGKEGFSSLRSGVSNLQPMDHIQPAKKLTPGLQKSDMAQGIRQNAAVPSHLYPPQHPHPCCSPVPVFTLDAEWPSTCGEGKHRWLECSGMFRVVAHDRGPGQRLWPSQRLPNPSLDERRRK